MPNRTMLNPVDMRAVKAKKLRKKKRNRIMEAPQNLARSWSCMRYNCRDGGIRMGRLFLRLPRLFNDVICDTEEVEEEDSWRTPMDDMDD